MKQDNKQRGLNGHSQTKPFRPFTFKRETTVPGKVWAQNSSGKKNSKWFFWPNKKGQGLVEYLILIALMGVATIGIVRTLNQTVKSRFANAIYALQGRNQKATTHTLKKEEYQRSDLSNFMAGSASSDKKKGKGSKKQTDKRR